LLLYKNDFGAGKYVPFEEHINNMKAYYYDSLQESSKEWENSNNDYVPFIENFLSTLYMCYKELDKRFNVVNSNKITKTARIEAVLGKMIKEEKIICIGKARASKYIKNNNI